LRHEELVSRWDIVDTGEQTAALDWRNDDAASAVGVDPNIVVGVIGISTCCFYKKRYVIKTVALKHMCVDDRWYHC
jgi:hypothetical protein